MTPCNNCSGWCARHALYKTPQQADLCRNDASTREILDSTAEARREGLVGSRTKTALESLGVTKERWVSLKERFGLAPSCSCPQREEWLNKVHAFLKGQK